MVIFLALEYNCNINDNLTYYNVTNQEVTLINLATGFGFEANEYERKKNQTSHEVRDIMHANSIEYHLESELYIMSSRNLNTVFIFTIDANYQINLQYAVSSEKTYDALKLAFPISFSNDNLYIDTSKWITLPETGDLSDDFYGQHNAQIIDYQANNYLTFSIFDNQNDY